MINETEVELPAKACGHREHVGTCGSCQRAKKARGERQMQEALAARIQWNAARCGSPAVAVAACR